MSPVGAILDMIIVPDPPPPPPDPHDVVLALAVRDELLRLNWLAESRQTLAERDLSLVDELRRRSAGLNAHTLSAGLAARRAITAHIARYLARTTGTHRIDDAPGGALHVPLTEFAHVRAELGRFGEQIVEQLQSYVAVRRAEARLAEALRKTAEVQP